jgi:Zn-dependent M28 family amino/carboxypeptidase
MKKLYWGLIGLLILTSMSWASTQMEKLENNLISHIDKLSRRIGERNVWRYKKLEETADYIFKNFESYGYSPQNQIYSMKGKPYRNIIAAKLGEKKPDEIIIVGAHYDSVFGSPGADDNGSGVAGLLELARLASGTKPDRTIKFIAFVNEEPPFFFTPRMGSRVYAREAKKKGENILAMISLEMIGYYSKQRKSQSYPPLFGFFYPDTADFIGVVGNLASRDLVKKIKEEFKRNSKFNIESIATFTFVPGVDFSDHSSFWHEGYKACMITDTAFYRYGHYHSSTDTFEKLDYQSMAQVVDGLSYVLEVLATR